MAKLCRNFNCIKNKKQHFLTTDSFSKEKLETIIKTININIYEFDSALQLLKTKDYSKKRKSVL